MVLAISSINSEDIAE